MTTIQDEDKYSKLMNDNALFLRAKAFLQRYEEHGAMYDRIQAIADLDELKRRNPGYNRIQEVVDLLVATVREVPA